MSAYVTLTPADSLLALVRSALAEDVGPGDWTTLWTVPGDRTDRATIVAKEDLIVAGTGAVVEVFRAVDPELSVEVVQRDGVRAARGSTVMVLEGRTRSILTGERVALNFLGRLSGVATHTRRFVNAVNGTRAKIVDTRKTTPGWRLLEKAAVRSGGGFNHRMGLHDMVMVKDNHIAAAGGIARALERVEAGRAEIDRELAVEVEVTSLEELEEVLESGVDRILLDNMEREMLCAAVERAAELGERRPELEASGNVTLETVREVAETGVDLISVGAITHSAPSADLSLRVEP